MNRLNPENIVVSSHIISEIRDKFREVLEKDGARIKPWEDLIKTLALKIMRPEVVLQAYQAREMNLTLEQVLLGAVFEGLQLEIKK